MNKYFNKMSNSEKEKNRENSMEKIISLCKRRGFIYPSSDIYGGIAGMWDYGPLGVALKNNIKNLWWDRFVSKRDDMFGMDASILMNKEVWMASGHVAGFSDPLVECLKCKKRFRSDHLPAVKEGEKKVCPLCGGQLGPERQFNMMFKTNVGPMEDESSVSYLRPETAQGMFVNFKNVVDSFHPRLPFGMAQIGKAFRNEISPRDFIFRTREFEQMEIEYFVEPEKWEESFNHWREEVIKFTKDVGLKSENVFELEIPDGERAHYSKRTIDFEFNYPFGKKELCGLAYRTDFDLSAHISTSNTDLSYYDDINNRRFVPHCIEPSFGLDRMILAVLTDAYDEDKIGDSERMVLRFSNKVAPVKLAVFPLLKNKEILVNEAKKIYQELKKTLGGGVIFDDNGNIGKRYRRQDEIGTPYCVTIDFETVEKGNGVTIRNRDTGEQKRIPKENILDAIKQ